MARLITLVAGLVLVLSIASACGDDDTAPAASLQDGTVVATEGGMNGGRIWFIWDGQRQRIQQPAGLEPDSLAALGLEVRSPAPARLTVGDSDGTFWHVMPADGPEAKLYLSYDGGLHEVAILQLDDAQVLALPEATDLVITRVRLPGD